MPDSFKDEFPERELPNGRAMIQFKCYVDERLAALRAENFFLLKTVRDTLVTTTEVLLQGSEARAEEHLKK